MEHHVGFAKVPVILFKEVSEIVLKASSESNTVYAQEKNLTGQKIQLKGSMCAHQQSRQKNFANKAQRLWWRMPNVA